VAVQIEQESRVSKLLVIDRVGREHRIAADSAATLMEVLRASNLGIAAICGGMLSCGTCHVYLDLPPGTAGPAEPSEDEAALAAGLTHYQPARSRIACQLPVTAIPTDATITVAPEE
jgi:2Fe-2S ferredoxin